MQLNLIDQHLNTLMLSTCRYRSGVMIASCGYETLSDVEDLATGGGCYPVEFECGLSDFDNIPAAYGESVSEALGNLEAKYARMAAAGLKPGSFADVLEALRSAQGAEWVPIYEKLDREAREELARLEERAQAERANPRKPIRLSLQLEDWSHEAFAKALWGAS